MEPTLLSNCQVRKKKKEKKGGGKRERKKSKKKKKSVKAAVKDAGLAAKRSNWAQYEGSRNSRTGGVGAHMRTGR